MIADKLTEQTLVLNPIGLDVQIEECLLEVFPKNDMALAQKKDLLKIHLDKIFKINGSVIFDPILEGDYILYNREKCPEMFVHLIENTKDRKYYYPVKYARIEIKL